MKRSSDFLPFGDLSPAEILGFLFIGLGTLLLLAYACGCGGAPFDAALDVPTSNDAGAAPLPLPDAPLAIGRADAGAPEGGLPEAVVQDAPTAQDAPPSGAGEDAGPPPDAAEADAPDDRPVKGFPEAASACRPAPLGGIGVPVGTTIVGASDPSAPASRAIDGDLSTAWNAGGPTGSLTLHFPAPVALTGVRLAAGADPATEESYAIAVGTSALGQATLAVPSSSAVLPPIDVAPGSYAGLTLTVNGGASWASVSEISILTAECP